MTRAILVCFHKYTPFGGEYYQPLFDFFISQMSKFKDEYDKIYFIDSTWEFTDDDYEKMKTVKGTLVKVDPSLRYYNAYKKVLPQVKEDLVLLMDNDMVVYQKNIIGYTFWLLNNGNEHLPNDVVSITDTIGTMEVPLKTGNKLCPYWFAAKKELLMKYRDLDWGPQMPYTETLGLLTKALLEDGANVYEMEDDKSEVKSWDPLKTEKTLDYYHVRAGSTAAYLLATKHYGNETTYDSYLAQQPLSEIIRHCEWYRYMSGDPTEIMEDLK